jgi:26S proteasome regulatory subunit N10
VRFAASQSQFIQFTLTIISPEVLVTHTKEIGQILTAVHDTSTNLGRTASIPTAIAIAQLALKHRQNKNLRQRVVVFVGSPLEDTSPDSERALIRLAKKLKKNNVALDLIAFGDGIEEAGEDGHSILRAFVEAASSSDNSCVTLSLSSPFFLTEPASCLDITSQCRPAHTSSPPSSSTRRSWPATVASQTSSQAYPVLPVPVAAAAPRNSNLASTRASIPSSPWCVPLSSCRHRNP